MIVVIPWVLIVMALVLAVALGVVCYKAGKDVGWSRCEAVWEQETRPWQSLRTTSTEAHDGDDNATIVLAETAQELPAAQVAADRTPIATRTVQLRTIAVPGMPITWPPRISRSPLAISARPLPTMPLPDGPPVGRHRRVEGAITWEFKRMTRDLEPSCLT